MIDHVTRWIEVAPLPDMTAQTVVEALLTTWISRFGCFSKVTTDQGRQFESELFRHLCKALGTKRIRTCAYHAQSDGLIENVHRTLKTALTACPGPKRWSENLPLILLMLRTSVNCEAKVSPAEAVYGQELRLPGDIFAPNPATSSSISERIIQATEALRSVTHHTTRRSHVPHRLENCSRVFLEISRITPPLTKPYVGPYPVLNRQEKCYTIQINSKPVTVSIDRLKPCILPCNLESEKPSIRITPTQSYPKTETSTPVETNSPSHLYTTRSGRKIKPVARFTARKK